MQLSFLRLFAATCIALFACQSASPLYPPTASSEIREACTLTHRRCTECHDQDRIVDARKSSDEWAATIERMRQMPGSTIRPDETSSILNCLMNRNNSDQPTAMLVR